MSAENSKSPHVLNASSNLLGLCFIVLTSLKVLKMTDITIIDTLTAVAIIFFMCSSILSFLSIRSKRGYGQRFEKVADVVFLSGLGFIFVVTMLIAFDIIR